MSKEKTLKVKRVFAYMIYNALKRTPPKDYASTGEIRTTISDILPALKNHIEEYVKLTTEAEELSVRGQAKEITEKELEDAIKEINGKWTEYSKEHGKEIIEVELDKETFTTLKAQFERDGWGKTWLANIEEFGELMEAFAETDK